MRRVSVLGGAGFIGTALCRQLAAAGIEFSILDLRPSRSFPEQSRIVDIRDRDGLRAHLDGTDIVHLAAVHRDDVRDPSAYQDTNVGGTAAVADVAAEKGIARIVFTSSVAVYGFAPVGTGEDGAIAPFNAYGRSKAGAEEVLRSWAAADASRRLLIVRPTVVFGEGNRGNVHTLLNQIASGRFAMIGAGRNRKSMAYVANVAAFLATALRHPDATGTYNYVDTPDLDMETLVSTVRRRLFGRADPGLRLPYALGLAAGVMADGVARLTGRRLPLSAVRVRKFAADTSFSSARADLAGFVPPWTLAEGLDRVLEAEFLSPDPDREIFFTE